MKRKGNVVARVVLGVDRTVIDNFVHETISNRVSLLCTDAFPGYDKLSYRYNHGTVDHQAGEHVVGAIHTNTIEGFWSLIKRGIMGSFHKVNRKYLPLYVAEFQFRYITAKMRTFSARQSADAEALLLAIWCSDLARVSW